MVIKGLGYDKYQTLLYTIPSGVVQILLLWMGVFACMLLPKNRTAVALVLVLPPLIGNIFLMRLTSKAGWGMIVASWLASCITAPWSILLSLTASNTKGNTKRSVVSTVFFIGYCTGCIAAPQLWTHSPRYISGVITAIVSWVLLFGAICAYRLVCARDNAKRNGTAVETVRQEKILLDRSGAAKADLTDKQDKSFRFSI